ncbi:uncharacterized protein LOC119297073 [Triticum dicoccoides]|uniref:uncharacterized protein LOC119297073 n=1 Tax=Triticum dicoccoides TaxID=85692 RepID=UPI00188F2173|nr:uncharacterized protein LOC119297073 [Triticum dicoccoides]
MASSSSVTRRKNTSPLLVSTPAEDTPHLHGDRSLPPPPAISAGRRPRPHPASSVERHRASPSSLSGNEDPLHRGRLTRQSQSESSQLSEDPPRPLDFSAKHGHLIKALPMLKVGPPVATSDPIVVSTTPPLVPIPVRSYNYLSKDEIEERQRQQRNMAEVVVVYRSVVLLIFTAALFYYEYQRLIILVSEIAAVSCLLLYLWSSHIMQFWLERPVTEDASLVVFVWCLVLCLLGFLVGVMISPVAAMAITSLAAICMSTFFVRSLHEYLHTRLACCLSEVGDSFSSAVAQGGHTKKRRSVSHQEVVAAKPPWK